MSSLDFDIGYSIYNREVGGSDRIFELHGHCFNPDPSITGTGDYTDTGSLEDAGIYSDSTVFSIPQHRPGHEVVIAHAKLFGDIDAGILKIEFKDTDNIVFFSYSSPIPFLGVGDWIYNWAYIGVRPASKGQMNEINKNGVYKAEASYTVNGDWSPTHFQSINFTVSNLVESSLTLIDTGSEPRKTGYFWVDDGFNPARLSYISQLGTKHNIRSDGTNYGFVGTNYKGYVWVPETANAKYLEYVDAGGYKRRTINGDTVGYNGTDGMPRTNTSDRGAIFAQSSFNWHALFFVNYSGQTVRLAQGAITSLGNTY